MNPSGGSDNDPSRSNIVSPTPVVQPGPVYDPLTTGPLAINLDTDTDSTQALINAEDERARRELASRQATKARNRFTKFSLMAAIFMIGLGLVVLRHNASNSNLNSTQEDASQRFPVTSIPLASLDANSSALNVGSTKTLSINGQLNVNNSIVITPSAQPSNAVPGQLYYNQQNNQLTYYNGTSFQTILAGNQLPVSSLGGATGQVTTGGGLNVTNNVIRNTGVLSLQGETGNVTLAGGPGLVVDGTTLSNSGVLSLGGSKGDIQIGTGLTINGNTLNAQGGVSSISGTGVVNVIDDGSGNYTISVAGSAGLGNVTSAGSTATIGTVALFTGVNNVEESSILSQSGTNLHVAGSLTLDTPLAVTSGGTGVASLTANSVLLGSPAGTGIVGVTAANPGLCLVSTAGAPAFQSCTGLGGVDKLNGLSGQLTLTGNASPGSISASGTDITIADASTSLKGLASFNSNEFTVTNGAVSTKQDVSANGTPTFKSLTLSDTPLGVGSGGLGLNALTAGELLYAASSGSVGQIAWGSSNDCLVSNGSGVAPSFQPCPGSGGSSGVTSVNALTGALVLQGGNVGSVSDDGNHTITIASGSDTVKGLVMYDNAELKLDGGGHLTTIQGIASTDSPSFVGLSLTGSALGVTSGGTGHSNFTQFGILYASGTAAISQLGLGASGECLISGGSLAAPAWGSCAGGGGSGVSSITGTSAGSAAITGALTLNNALTSSTTITIDKASSSQYGLVEYDGTNIKDNGGGKITTAQGITTADAPTFGQLTLTSSTVTSGDMLTINNTSGSFTGNLLNLKVGGVSKLSVSAAGNISGGTLNGQTISSAASFSGSVDVTTNLNVGNTLQVNTISPTAAMTIGVAGQQFTLQGNASSTIAATSGSFTSTVGFQTPTANATFKFPAVAAGSYDICTTSGNCAGLNGTVTLGSPHAQFSLPMFGTGSTIQNSIVSQDSGGTTLTVGGILAVNTISPTAALTVGVSTQNLTLQGAGVSVKATSGANTSTLSFVVPTANRTIHIPDSSGTVVVSASGALSIDAAGNITCPDCLTGGGGGSSGVTSLNGLDGSITIQGGNTGTITLGSGTVNIATASDTVLGLVMYDNVNIKSVGGQLTTVQGITTTSSPQFADVHLTGNLQVDTDATVSGDMLVSGTLSLTNALDTADGGTGLTAITNHGILIGGGSNTITQLGAGASGQCLTSDGTTPQWGSCAGFGGSSGVDSVTGSDVGSSSLNGSITINNASTGSGSVTIDTASNSKLGLIKYDGTNLVLNGSSQLTTVQDITTTSAPTFGQLTLTSSTVTSGNMLSVDNTSGSFTGNLLNLKVGGVSKLSVDANGNTQVAGTLAVNTIANTGALTVGVTGQSFTLQGNASSVLKATSGTFTTTVGFQSPTANVTYQFAAASAGGSPYDICTTAGNCVGSGGGGTGSGTQYQIAMFNNAGGTTVGNSMLSQNSAGTVLTVGTSGAGTLAVDTIAPTGALTVGVTTQNTTIQGAALSLSSTNSSHTTTLSFTAPTANHTISVPDAGGTIAVSASGALSLDAAGNLTCPDCLTGGGGGSSGVSSLNGMDGSITIQGGNTGSITLGSGTISIATASNTVLGLVMYDNTDIITSGGKLTTAQGITTGSTPQFAGLQLTNALGVAYGGTGLQSISADGLLYGSGTNTIGQLGLGTSGQCLTSNGVGNAPTWQDCLSSGAGGVSVSVSHDQYALTMFDTLSGTSIASSMVSQNAAADTLTVSGTLAVNTIAPTTALTIDGDLAVNDDLQVTGNTTLDNALGVGSGGTGLNTISAHGILYGSAADTVGQLGLGTSGQCLTSNGTGADPTWEDCPGSTGAGGVSTGGGTQYQIAMFDNSGGNDIGDSIMSENSGGTIISITGDLDVSGGLTLGTALAVANGGTGHTTLTQNSLLYGNAAGSVGELGFGATSGLCLLSQGGTSLPIWDTCPGAGGGGLTGSGTTGKLAVWSGGALTDGDITDSGSAVGLASGVSFAVQGAATFQAATPSATAFLVKNAANAVLSVDTSGNQVVFGKAGALDGKLAVASATGGVISIVPTSTASNFTLTLPADTGILCDSTGNCSSAYQVAGSYANTTLSNLGTTAINAALNFQNNQTATIDFGSAATAAGNLLQITGQTGATANAGGAVTIKGGTGTTSGNGGLLTLQGGNTTSGTNGGVTIDTGSGASTPNGTVSIGTTNAATISVGNSTAGTAVTIQGGTGSSAVGIQAATNGTISIASANDNIVNIGTGSTSKAITIGSTTGTGNIAIGQSTQTNHINIGNGVVATTKTQFINIGAGASSAGNVTIGIGNGSADGGSGSTVTLNIGNGASTTGTDLVNIGGATATSTTLLQGGSGTSGNGAVSIQALTDGRIGIGNGQNDFVNIGSSSSTHPIVLQGTDITATLTGDSSSPSFVLQSTTTNTAGLFQVQNSAGANGTVFSVNTTANAAILGTSSHLNGTLTFDNSTDTNTISFVAGSGGTLSTTATGAGTGSFGAPAASLPYESETSTTTGTMKCSLFTLGSQQNATATSMTIYTGATAASAAYSMAIYTGNGNQPTTEVAATSSGTLSTTPGAANTLSISASLTANTQYWLCANTSNSTARWLGSSIPGSHSAWKLTQTYGTWPSTVTNPSGTDYQVTYDMTVNYTLAGTGSTVGSINSTGQTTLQGVNNNGTAFQVQDTAGESVLSVSTGGPTGAGVIVSNGNLYLSGLSNPTGATFHLSSGGSLPASTRINYYVDAVDAQGNHTEAMDAGNNTGIVTGTGSTNRTADISWNAVSGATSYTVYFSELYSFAYSSYSVPGGTTSLVDNGTIFAIAAAGANPSIYSSEASGITMQGGMAIRLNGNGDDTAITYTQYNQLLIDNSNSGGSVTLQADSFVYNDDDSGQSVFQVAGSGATTIQTNPTNISNAFVIEDTNGVVALQASTLNVTAVTSGNAAVLKVGKTTGGLSIEAAGAININNTDYAEYFYQVVPGQLQPGDITCATTNNKVERCNGDQNSQLLGVVSTDPGIVGGGIYDENHPENTATVAMLGQVPVKVSNANGAIHIGDMLTFDPVTGLAIKATKASMTIGQALEDFSGTTGTINLYIHIGYYDPMGLQSDGVSNGYVVQNLNASLANVTVDSLIVSGDITINGHIVTGGGTPTMVTQTAAGIGSTVAVSGTDTSGKITVTLGTASVIAGDLAQLTFHTTFSAAPNVTITAGDSNAAQIQQFVDPSTTGFTLSAATTTGLTPGQTYIFYYHVIQ